MDKKIENLNPEKTALLMIDMQKAFVEPEAALCIAGAKATIPACEAALEDAQARHQSDLGEERIQG